jgi:pimeloyl-ACP methyl ester carboxylesterase
MERDQTKIHYDVYGGGYPILLFAPGGMHSVAQMWRENPRVPGQPMPWIDPTRDLSDEFRVIAMDQRNAGASTGPVVASDGWPTYTQDHLDLVDHLDIERLHLMGGCIGSSYCLSFCQAAPTRVSAAVLQNPIGLTPDNRQDFYSVFDDWADQLKASRPDVTDQSIGSFRDHMFGGDFVFSVDRDFVRHCSVPLLVLAGNDQFHPRAVAEEIADLAPSAELVIEWAGPDHKDGTRQKIRDFLGQHTPRA